MKPKLKQSMILSSLNYLSNLALYELIDGDDFDDKTKDLANRVLNNRKC